MDVIGGLTAAKMALDLAKDLREIDKSVDEAAFKMKLAELMSALADTQIAFADTKNRIAELESEIERLTMGDLCPMCREGRLEVITVENHEYSVSTQFHSVECRNEGCIYRATRVYNTTRGCYAE